MFIAKVVGNVVATRKNESLEGYKLMVVQRHNVDSEESDADHLVAADYVGAGIGDYVLVSSGSAVRVEENKKKALIDLAIVGIIDEFLK